MRLVIAVWCCLLGAVCAKPSYEQEIADKALLESIAVGRAEERLAGGGGMEHFFKAFAREEMMDYLHNIPETLSRFSIDTLSTPCVSCMKEYLRCKDICLQLLPESNLYFFDQFACLSVCWQRVVSCCIAASRTPIHLSEKDYAVLLGQSNTL